MVSGWLGPETWKLAGQYTGTYTGGGVNFVAVGRAVDTSPDLYAAAIAADNVTTTIWVAICLIIPTALARWWPDLKVGSGVATSDSPEVVMFNQTQRPVTIADAAALVTIAVGAVWVAGRLGDLTPGVPSVLWLTTIVLIIAQIPAVQGVAGGPLGGNYVMHLFLATIGAQSILAEIMRVGPVVFYFTLIVVGVHGAVILGVGRLLRLDLPTLALASQANVGGPASALALATSRG